MFKHTVEDPFARNTTLWHIYLTARSDSVWKRCATSEWWWMECTQLHFIIIMITHGCNSYLTHLILQLGLARLAQTCHTNKYAFLFSPFVGLKAFLTCLLLWGQCVGVCARSLKCTEVQSQLDTTDTKQYWVLSNIVFLSKTSQSFPKNKSTCQHLSLPSLPTLLICDVNKGSHPVCGPFVSFYLTISDWNHTAHL